MGAKATVGACPDEATSQSTKPASWQVAGYACDDFSSSRAGLAPTASLSPNQQRWRRFRRNRLGYASLLIFAALFVISLFAEVLSNDRPLVVSYEGELYFPLLKDYPETTVGAA